MRLFKRTPTTPKLEDIDTRLGQIDDEIERLHAAAAARQAERQHAAQVVQRLTEEAASGTLRDPGRLAAALLHQRQLEADTGVDAQIEKLRAERDELQTLKHEAIARKAHERYDEAVRALAEACRPILALQAAVEDAARAAGVVIGPGTTKWPLPERYLFIGGARIDLTRPVE